MIERCSDSNLFVQKPCFCLVLERLRLTNVVLVKIFATRLGSTSCHSGGVGFPGNVDG